MLNFGGFWGVWYGDFGWLDLGARNMAFLYFVYGGREFVAVCTKNGIPLHGFCLPMSGVRVHICPRAKIILDFACYVC